MLVSGKSINMSAFHKIPLPVKCHVAFQKYEELPFSYVQLPAQANRNLTFASFFLHLNESYHAAMLYLSFFEVKCMHIYQRRRKKVYVCAHRCMHTYINHSRMRVETHFTTQKSDFYPKALKELSYAKSPYVGPAEA